MSKVDEPGAAKSCTNVLRNTQQPFSSLLYVVLCGMAVNMKNAMLQMYKVSRHKQNVSMSLNKHDFDSQKKKDYN